MYTKLKKINEGFTIVETLIVLAIAALIITIILIAVPDLQRSSRNTDILHDAQNIASGVQTFEGNNDGELPNSATLATDIVTISDTTAGASNATASAHVQTSDTITVKTGALTDTYTQVPQGTIVVDLTADCGTGSTPGTTSVDNRGVAIIYPIEAASVGSSSVGCIQE